MKSAVFFLALAGSALAQSSAASDSSLAPVGANSTVPVVIPTSAGASTPTGGRNTTVTTASVTATKTSGSKTSGSKTSGSSSNPTATANGAAAATVGASMMAALVGLMAVAL